MFLFEVKDPSTFVEDADFGKYEGKETILKLKNVESRTMNKVRVWYGD